MNKTRYPFKIGDEILALAAKNKKRLKGRIVTVEKVWKGEDGKWWIRATWPGRGTEAEAEMDEVLRQNGIKVDYFDDYFVEGPEDKFSEFIL